MTPEQKAEAERRFRISITNSFNSDQEPNWEGFEEMLRFGCDVNIQDDSDRTLLMLAAKKGNSSLARRLLFIGAEANIIDNEGRKALDYATEERVRHSLTFFTNEVQPSTSCCPSLFSKGSGERFR